MKGKGKLRGTGKIVFLSFSFIFFWRCGLEVVHSREVEMLDQRSKCHYPGNCSFTVMFASSYPGSTSTGQPYPTKLSLIWKIRMPLSLSRMNI